MEKIQLLSFDFIGKTTYLENIVKLIILSVITYNFTILTLGFTCKYDIMSYSHLQTALSLHDEITGKLQEWN